MDTTSWLLVVMFLALAGLDWAAVHVRSTWLEYLCKPGCMVVLIGAAASIDVADDGARTALVAALALSLLGDVFLMVRGERDDLFLAGLGSFLFAHVAYVVAFLLAGVEGAGLVVGTALALVLVLGVGRPTVVAVRRGDEPAMAAPVAAYVGVISVMVLVAAGAGWLSAVGALLFAGSDALIARNKFVRPSAWAPLAIMVGYHLAQVLLVVSFAQD